MIFQWLKNFSLFEVTPLSKNEAVDSEREALRKESTQEEVVSNRVLVPVARDGSCLGHRCVRTKGVQIGPRKSEFYVASLEEALAILKAEHEAGKGPARWRRPNEKGHFGTVAAVAWEERPREEVFGEEKCPV